MSKRERLQNRRSQTSIDFWHDDLKFNIGFGQYNDGKSPNCLSLQTNNAVQ